MYPTAPSEGEIFAIHEALIEGSRAELALACDPRVPSGVALIVLPHGSPVAEVAFGSRAEVARELAIVQEEEGPGAVDLTRTGAELLARSPPDRGRLYCVVVALGRARIHEIQWPRAEPPRTDA